MDVIPQRPPVVAGKRAKIRNSLESAIKNRFMEFEPVIFAEARRFSPGAKTARRIRADVAGALVSARIGFAAPFDIFCAAL